MSMRTQYIKTQVMGPALSSKNTAVRSLPLFDNNHQLSTGRVFQVQEASGAEPCRRLSTGANAAEQSAQEGRVVGGFQKRHPEVRGHRAL